MATPIGHALAGAIVYAGFRRAGWKTPSMIAAIVAANLPDIDFFPGLFVHALRKYHHGVTHSIGAVVVGAVLLAAVWMLARRLRLRRLELPFLKRGDTRPASTTTGIGFLRLTLFFGACILSHVLIDYITVDRGGLIGIPLLWPFGKAFYIAVYPIFGDVWRAPLFSKKVIIHNLCNVIVEVIAFVPILVLLLYFRRRKEEKKR